MHNSQSHKVSFYSFSFFTFFYSCIHLFAFSFYKYLLRTYLVLITLLLVRKTKINNSFCPQDTNNPMRNGETYTGNKIQHERSMKVITNLWKRTLRSVIRKREWMSRKDLEKFTFKLNLNGWTVSTNIKGNEWETFISRQRRNE